MSIDEAQRPNHALSRLVLVGCAALLLGWSASVVAWPPGANIPRHVLLILLAWAAWVIAIRAVLALGSPAGGQVRSELALIFIVAAAMRVVILFSTPSLSDDVYRAVWDARLMHAGVNPYALPPNAPELAPYRDATIWPRVNQPDQRTPYPPLAELLSGAAYALLPERLVAMQALAAAADLLGAGALAWLLGRLGSDPRRALVIAWSPLGSLHFAHSGHNDAMMIAAIVAGVLSLTFGRRALAMAALGVGTMIKATPAFAVPTFVRSTGLVAAGAWVGVCVLLALPLLGAGPALALGVMQEAGSEQFNDSIHFVLERAALLIAPARAGAVASALGLLCVLVVAAIAWRRSDGSPRATLIWSSRILAAYICIAPVVEPWYFTWLAPLIALRIDRSRIPPFFGINEGLAWLWIAGMASLTDLTYLPGGTGLWVIIRCVEYVPVYGMLSLCLIRSIRGGNRNAPTASPSGH